MPGGRHLDEIGASASHARADRAHANVGDFRGLGIGITENLGEDEGLSAFFLQLINEGASVHPFRPRLTTSGLLGRG